MDNTYANVFLYLACAYALGGAVIAVTRRLRLNDLPAYLLSGMVLGAILFNWQSAKDTVIPTSQWDYRINQKTYNILQHAVRDTTSLSFIEPYRRTAIHGERAFLDSLQFYLNIPLSDTLSSKVLMQARQPSKDPITIILNWLIQLGLLLFMVNLGANYDPAAIRYKLTPVILAESAIVLIVNSSGLLIVGLYLFNGSFASALLVMIALLSFSVTTIISLRLTDQISWKEPIDKLLKSSLMTDLIALAGYTIVLFVTLNMPTAEQLGFLSVLAAGMIIIVFAEQLWRYFAFLREWSAEIKIFLRIASILLLIYCGYRFHFPLLVLGLISGLMLNLMLGKTDLYSRKRIFGVVSILYPLVFITIGYRMYNLWAQTSFDITQFVSGFLIAFTLIAVVLAIIWKIKRADPAFIALGIFPRGEIAALIIWQMWEQNLIDSRLFLGGLLAILFSSVIGGIIRKFLPEGRLGHTEG
jgi:hypothetical protein